MKPFPSFFLAITVITSIFVITILVIWTDRADSLQRKKVIQEKKREYKCGYKSCTKSDPDKLNIHIVAHTHDDVGWLKTVEQYYLGTQENIQRACVRDIIDNVVDALIKNPKRKFIYVETAYLWRWWIDQSEQKRQEMKNLIEEGRLEIIGGGWSMNDEATTHYQSMIDQHTWGFRRLSDVFGECARPRIGWQIDPFGHSREQASMFAKFGFDGLFLGRVNYQDREQRLKDKTMEFVWKGSPSLGASANIFTSALYNEYSTPPGFCFDDILCRDVRLYDDPQDANYNIGERLELFFAFANKQASMYRTNNIIITMGGDFHYRLAETYLKNVDKLISGINSRNGTKYRAFYSTPSCYLKAVHEQNLTWTTKSDDFFPYVSSPHAAWTGYFTSRPTVKFFERMGNNFLQIVKQVTVLTNASDSKKLEQFREIMGVMQHHDAVTGTEKQHVANDYAQILHDSIKNGENLVFAALRKWMIKTKPEREAQFYTCLLMNISSCVHTTVNSKFVVTVYNPTSQLLDTYIRLPVPNSHYGVKNFKGKNIVTQIVPIPEMVLKIPGRSAFATKELVFQASNIEPFGYQSFYVYKLSDRVNAVPIGQPEEHFTEIKSQNYKIAINDQGNVFVKTSTGIEFEHSFEYYESKWGFNGPSNRSSGAYVFRPKGNRTKKLSAKNTLKIFKGPLVQEMHQKINDWVSQVIRVYREAKYVEFNWLVGPIPVEFNDVGKEIITKYTSNVKNKDEFYTDSNGREMLKRKLNYKPTYNLVLEESVAGNYYPVSTKISIEDENLKRRLSVLTDRAEGGTSLREGEIELMIHRKILRDDGLGVNESLNETAYNKGLVVRGQHILIAGSLYNRDELFLQEKEEAIKLSMRPWIFITPVHESFEKWNQHYNMKEDGMIGKLPKNIRILTLEPWKDNTVLLRLEHVFEKNESSKYSVETQVNIKDLFPNFNVLSIIETTLGANQAVEENQRLKWRSIQNEDPVIQDEKLNFSKNGIIVSLKPMEIRTFVINISIPIKI